mmetsp:Transcript_58614/g.163517  ORF Transcript_58614/g.163517 Transcript_58614/m.163517 type:complete len:255 (+) Transcript_58614:1188-1952(+)
MSLVTEIRDWAGVWDAVRFETTFTRKFYLRVRGADQGGSDTPQHDRADAILPSRWPFTDRAADACAGGSFASALALAGYERQRPLLPSAHGLSRGPRGVAAWPLTAVSFPPPLAQHGRVLPQPKGCRRADRAPLHRAGPTLRPRFLRVDAGARADRKRLAATARCVCQRFGPKHAGRFTDDLNCDVCVRVLQAGPSPRPQPLRFDAHDRAAWTRLATAAHWACQRSSQQNAERHAGHVFEGRVPRNGPTAHPPL